MVGQGDDKCCDPEEIGSELLLESAVFDVRRVAHRLPGGMIISRDAVVHPGAVVILAQDENGDLILIRQYRYAIGRWILELPAGTLEKGESPHDCAKREIVEETGLAAREWEPLGLIIPAPGFCSEEQHLFVARGLYAASAGRDEDELIETVRMSPAQVEAAIAEGAIVDAKTIAAFARARFRQKV